MPKTLSPQSTFSYSMQILCRGVGHGDVHHEALLKIIILKANILPVDNDILYKDYCM